jgi:hypothetical protein
MICKDGCSVASWVAKIFGSMLRCTTPCDPLRRQCECYADSKMIDAMLDKIRALDLDREYRVLTTHVAVTSPFAVELLAGDQFNTPAQEARRIAAIQLHVVHDLASKLTWLESVCVHPGIEPGVRAGFTAILRSLTNESELLPVVDSQAAVLLEPALLFHALLSRLRPWIGSTPPLEPDSVLELLQLGVADYLRPLLRQRFETLWLQFHQLRQLPVARLSLLTDPPRIDANRLQRMLADPRLSAQSCPPAPPWVAPTWATPWTDDLPARPSAREWYHSSELTG